MNVQLNNTLLLREKIEAKYSGSKSTLFKFYDTLFSLLGGNGENTICNNMCIQNNCDCCEFPQADITEKGKPANTFTGLLPYEIEYLSLKSSPVSFEEKFDVHESGLGLVCRKIEKKCIRKPLDCALYPYTFANYSNSNENIFVDILFSKEKCPIFSNTELTENFFSITFERTVNLAHTVAEFDTDILILICSYAPYYRGFDRYKTVMIRTGQTSLHNSPDLLHTVDTIPNYNKNAS